MVDVGHYIHFSEYFETKISDKYLTWGWKNTKRKCQAFGIIIQRLLAVPKPSLLTAIIPSMSIFNLELKPHSSQT